MPSGHGGSSAIADEAAFVSLVGSVAQRLGTFTCLELATACEAEERHRRGVPQMKGRAMDAYAVGVLRVIHTLQRANLIGPGHYPGPVRSAGACGSCRAERGYSYSWEAGTE
jgi:hypothetical protein